KQGSTRSPDTPRPQHTCARSPETTAHPAHTNTTTTPPSSTARTPADPTHPPDNDRKRPTSPSPPPRRARTTPNGSPAATPATTEASKRLIPIHSNEVLSHPEMVITRPDRPGL